MDERKEASGNYLRRGTKSREYHYNTIYANYKEDVSMKRRFRKSTFAVMIILAFII